MEALLKRYYTKVQYFIGSVMNIADLQRVQVNRLLEIMNRELIVFDIRWIRQQLV